MEIAKWERGFETLFKADAQQVAAEILSIGESATPQQIVAKAKDAKTELHKCFDWNDQTAAEKYRIHQARQIVCHLVIQRPESNTPKQEMRFFFKVRENEGYKPTERIFRNEDEHALLLARARAELAAFQRKYNGLTELSGLFAAINAAIS